MSKRLFWVKTQLNLKCSTSSTCLHDKFNWIFQLNRIYNRAASIESSKCSIHSIVNSVMAAASWLPFFIFDRIVAVTLWLGRGVKSTWNIVSIVSTFWLCLLFKITYIYIERERKRAVIFQVHFDETQIGDININHGLFYDSTYLDFKWSCKHCVYISLNKVFKQNNIKNFDFLWLIFLFMIILSF